MKFSLLKNLNKQSPKLTDDKINKVQDSEKNLTSEKNSFLNQDIKYDNIVIKSKKQDSSILDRDIIEFVIKNFPEASNLISSSLIDLRNSIENSIDIIEDTSNKLVKDKRNFNLSAQYRETSISLYKISNDIENYINWMESMDEDNLEPLVEEDNSYKKLSANLVEDICLSYDSNVENELNIFSDFTNTIPKSFVLDNKEFIVEDWNDLVIKTADSLIKIYKASKEIAYNEIIIPELPPKKSFENEFRDTIIEMLIEYNIDPSRYKVIVY